MTLDANIKQVIVVRKDLNMRKGKIAAQVAHASMKFLVEEAAVGHREADDKFVIRKMISRPAMYWLNGSFTKVVVSVDSEEALKALIEAARVAKVECHAIWDSGRTEFHGVSTLTCAAFGPDEAEKLDAITGGCKLL